MTETRIKLYTRNPEHSTFDNDQMQKKKKKWGRSLEINFRLFLGNSMVSMSPPSGM